MFVNILFFAFLSAFTAIVALGHVMLLAAIWPDLFASNPSARGIELGRGVDLEPGSGAARHVHLPN